ncbi:hypothetical protein AAHA92_13775 [Salvia divinorum]|uniref:Uncharacterized protein n=1 Tax=Salvia divinorum TaxID=28513 RepID=A0ABD1H9C8_SALDI
MLYYPLLRRFRTLDLLFSHRPPNHATTPLSLRDSATEELRSLPRLKVAQTLGLHFASIASDRFDFLNFRYLHLRRSFG